MINFNPKVMHDTTKIMPNVP